MSLTDLHAHLEEIAKEIDEVLTGGLGVSDELEILDRESTDKEYDVGYYPAQAGLVIARHLANTNKLLGFISKQLLSIQLQMAENSEKST